MPDHFTAENAGAAWALIVRGGSSAKGQLSAPLQTWAPPLPPPATHVGAFTLTPRFHSSGLESSFVLLRRRSLSAPSILSLSRVEETWTRTPCQRGSGHPKPLGGKEVLCKTQRILPKYTILILCLHKQLSGNSQLYLLTF